MPASIVLHLQAAHPGTYRHATGPGVHGWWFQRWQTFNPALADAMHQPGRFAPFTLSPILGIPTPQGPVEVAEGCPAWLRLTVLSTELEAHLPAFLDSLPAVLAVDGIVWQVNGISRTPEEFAWAGAASYDDMRSLLDQHNPPDLWTLEMVTPTAFNGKKTQFPFPLPDLMIRSWLERWNAFAPFALPDDLVRIGREDLSVANYSLRTLKISEGIRQAIGCTGRLTLRAIEVHPAMRVALHLLFTFAFYSGTGYHTTQGMGQTRLLRER